jgi:hypothetical protein
LESLVLFLFCDAAAAPAAVALSFLLSLRNAQKFDDGVDVDGAGIDSIHYRCRGDTGHLGEMSE